MDYTSIVVALGADAGCDGRVQFAAHIAAAQGCHLLGIATARPDAVATGVGGGVGSRLEAVQAAHDGSVQHAGAWIDRFERIAQAAGVASFEAEIGEGDAATAVLHEARCADLAVIGQVDPAGADAHAARRFVEQVLMHNARPTLVVPAGHRHPAPPEGVLVAWDDSHGCARAVSDALPLLRRAARVHLRSWHEPGDALGSLVHDRLVRVQAWLRRHGVESDIEVRTTSGRTGPAMLAQAHALAADLVVMGTYGHSVWSERLLGGATRTALQRSPVPLLMSR